MATVTISSNLNAPRIVRIRQRVADNCERRHATKVLEPDGRVRARRTEVVDRHAAWALSVGGIGRALSVASSEAPYPSPLAGHDEATVARWAQIPLWSYRRERARAAILRRMKIHRSVRGLCLAVAAALLSACATVAYDGPRRPDHEVAMIGGISAKITCVDGRDMEGGDAVVLPGLHLVAAKYRDAKMFSVSPHAICFRTEAGRVYDVRGVLLNGGPQWALTITDPETGEQVASREVAPWSKDCSPPPPPPPPSSPPPARRLTLVAPRLIADVASDEGRDADAPGGSEGAASESPSLLATPAAPSVETPGATTSTAAPVSSAPAVSPPAETPPPPRLMHTAGSGGGLELGGGWGGEELARATLTNGEMQTMHAGDGGTMSLAGSWTPLWIGYVIGFGVSGDIGFKVTEIGGSNGALKLLRYPASLSLQALVPLGQRVYFVVRGGVVKELGVSVNGTGVVSSAHGSLVAPAGPHGELGFLIESLSQLAVGFKVRYTSIHYEAGAERADASNVTLALGFYFFN